MKKVTAMIDDRVEKIELNNVPNVTMVTPQNNLTAEFDELKSELLDQIN